MTKAKDNSTHEKVNAVARNEQLNNQGTENSFERCSVKQGVEEGMRQFDIGNKIATQKVTV